MAQLRKRGPTWYIAFWWGGRLVGRSLRTGDKAAAERLKGRIELQIQNYRLGIVAPPDGCDVVEWLFTAGQRSAPTRETSTAVRTLGELLERYAQAMPAGSRADSTVATEAIHHKHLRQHLKARTPLAALDVETLQRYVTARTGGVRPVIAETTKKELASLGVAWRWATGAKIAPAPPDFTKIRFPKAPEPERFRHAGQIRAEIAARGLKGSAAATLWKSLVLTLEEVREFVEFARGTPHQWFGDVIAVAAYTGARRSELCRMTAADVDLARGELTIREKKRVRERSESKRVVQIAKALRPTLKRLASAGGPLFVWGKNRLTPVTISNQWQDRRKNSPWAHVKGLHVLRHSFASNLAAKGVSQALIDEWMGHQTDEMRKRYRHFFPAEKSKAIDALG